MTTYAGGCSVSVTMTPASAGGLTYNSSATVTVNVSPRPVGARYPTYEDADGQKQTIYLTEDYKARNISQDTGGITYSRRFFIIGTYETTDCLDIGPQIGEEDDLIAGQFVVSRKLTMYAKGGAGFAKTEVDVVALAVEYAPPTEPQSSGGDSEGTVTFDFASESEHVDTAIAQEHYGTQPNASEDLLINFDDENGVEGLEIDAPILSFSEQHMFTEAEFSPAFRAQLAASIKKTNLNAWREYEAESVLLDGASAQKRNKTWYVTFRFRTRVGFVNKDFTVYRIQDNALQTQVVKVTKPGWHYLWVKSIKLAANDAFQFGPTSIHVAQVYETLDFATLGIGSQPVN